MNILLTGATGYIGSAIRPALIASGHTVTALVRASGGEGDVVGDMRDKTLVRRLAEKSDAVIHTATPGDETSADADRDFADAVLSGLDGVFVRTGGIWVYGEGEAITEESPIAAPPIVAWREEVNRRVLGASNVRSVLVEPGVVYGRGGGIPRMLSEELIGDGSQHWATVHVDDLADFYALALERAGRGEKFLAVSGVNPTVRELGEAVSRRKGLGGRVVPEEPGRTVGRLGEFGRALLLDQQASGEKGRRVLGWRPRRRSLVAEIEAGGYDGAPVT
ncbi:NAD-dependent epimerase/dehydratase family protein [Actinoplanes sp. NPDC051861]|uniref:NAD-dependent epimerase/dehydratase family protein n=1 Tax=Actinoplanes sp. NPDC051861 TaxID=3155170 RepID=UPI00341C52E1